MKYEVLLLGERLEDGVCNICSTVIRNNKILHLLNCGDGTQKYFIDNNLSFARVQVILITNLGRQIFGLPGFLAMLLYKKPHDKQTTVIGPKGLKDHLKNIFMITDTYISKLNLVIMEVDGTEQEQVFKFDIESKTSMLFHAYAVSGNQQKIVYKMGECRMTIDRHKAMDMGVTQGCHFKDLSNYKPVTLETGITIDPSQLTKITYNKALLVCPTISEMEVHDLKQIISNVLNVMIVSPQTNDFVQCSQFLGSLLIAPSHLHKKELWCSDGVDLKQVSCEGINF
ncbi:hypothetical protein AKO1_007615 [Acrasis kona]|uniref:Uncharacterized protein n=1 Tax=Acrasis kona TaxID=1008807 RepID=A0AAW2YR17_9EUKA